MKQLWRITERYYPWLLLLLGVDCFCAIILWISDIQAFQPLIGLVVLTSLLLFSAILFVLNKRETTRRELFRDFLSDPTICNEERLLSAISREEGESIRLLASVLQEHKTESNSMADALQDYEEYVEGWAHEAKTPLSLLTIKQGESVGYSRAFTATRDSLIAILPIGYADGFPRNLSCGNSYALIGGRQAPIVGKICMDQLAVDVTDIPNVKTGSIATLIGKDGKEEITAPMVAESAESITNELLSRMGHRLNIIRRA